ncbi:MAG: 50S ribosomal protein L11 methyltransferase [candidate division Zixibacteria bacterium]|nr:50S ribosomal protein L11 methyltransferase [candidate division Zixibacteria bacterium]
MKTNSGKIKSYTEFTISLQPDIVEFVCDFIIDNITNGLVLEDEESNEITSIKFYVSSENEKDIKGKLNNFFESQSSKNQEKIKNISTQIVENISWEEEYKKSVQPVWIGSDIVIVPTWKKDEFDAKFKILIEPKMAFGTGTHETTRSCLKVIREEFKSQMTFLDLGCGSGILSILAEKLDAKYIKAIDYDPIAVENCNENFELNNVETFNDICLGSIELCKNDKPYDFVCANIIRSTIVEMLSELLRLTKTGGILVLSGLLEQDLEEINKALINFEYRDITIHPDNEWRTILVRKH